MFDKPTLFYPKKILKSLTKTKMFYNINSII